MKLVRYAFMTLMVAASVAIVAPSADAATSVGAASFEGEMHVGQYIASGAGAGLYTILPSGCGTASAQPATVSGPTCFLGAAGNVTGNCAAFTGSMSGGLDQFNVGGSYAVYSVSFSILVTGAQLTIDGVASGNGHQYRIVGEGVATLDPTTGQGNCLFGDLTYIIAGSLTLVER